MAVKTPTQLKAIFVTGAKPTQQNFADFIESAIPYLKYTALLTQSGTNAPVATILENTLGEIPTWLRSGVGVYTLNTVGNVFTANKTFSPQNGVAFFNVNSLNTTYFEAARASDIIVTVRSSDSTGTNADDIIGNTTSGGLFFFQIFIYP